MGTPCAKAEKGISTCQRQIKRLGRYGGPLDFKVERFTCGGCLHFLLMVVGFAHRPFRSQTEVFTREYLMKDLADFPPSRKNVDRKWEKMECTGTHLQADSVIFTL